VSLLLASLTSSPLTLPLLIFLAEMTVVTLGTIRIIFVSRGMKFLAPMLGFFEIMIWLFAIGQIMQNLSNASCYMAFAGGFTAGNFLGILVEKRLALGTLVVRIITNRDATELIDGLKSAGYGVTRIDGQGATGAVQVVFTVIKRRELENVVAIIEGFDPRAFYSVDDLQSASKGVFPAEKAGARALLPGPLRLVRVAKET
jgi:uncharacterized protein YebE (UPF0316 family)